MEKFGLFAMITWMRNYAFIDGNNLHLGVTKGLGWTIDYARFRIYLKEKYHVDKAFLFVGYQKDMKYLYGCLKKEGYELIF